MPEWLRLSRSFREQIDYEAVARDYDALWIPHPYPYRLTLNSHWFNVMDVESTLWFRWKFKEQEGHRVGLVGREQDETSDVA